MTSSTIARRLTADVPAAIATIALEGPHSVDLIKEHVRFSRAVGELEIGRIYYGAWLLSTLSHASAGAEQEAVGEQVVLCRTSSQTVEVHCHGGAAVCRAILDTLQHSGCQLETASQWPGQQIGHLARAAEQDLLKSTTDRTAAILLDQMQGALQNSLEELLNSINQADAPAALALIDELIDRSHIGLHLIHPWRIVLAGPPNVGKSSLMNALAGTQQSIVHHEPGTTRDWLEALAAIDGWPVILSDTAGIRVTTNAIERAGVERSRQQIQSADLPIVVVDALRGWTEEHQQIMNSLTVAPLIVLNKVDLCAPDIRLAHSLPGGAAVCVLTSTVGEPGTAALLTALSQRLCCLPLASRAAVPFRSEQIDCLNTCRQLVQSSEFTQASQFLSGWLHA